MSHYSKILYAVQIFLDKKWDFRTVWNKGEEVFQDLKITTQNKTAIFLMKIFIIHDLFFRIPQSKFWWWSCNKIFGIWNIPPSLDLKNLKIKTFLRGSQNLFYDKALIIIANLYTFVILLYDIKNAVFVFLSVPQISHA